MLWISLYKNRDTGPVVSLTNGGDDICDTQRHMLCMMDLRLSFNERVHH